MVNLYIQVLLIQSELWDVFRKKTILNKLRKMIALTFPNTNLKKSKSILVLISMKTSLFYVYQEKKRLFYINDLFCPGVSSGKLFIVIELYNKRIQNGFKDINIFKQSLTLASLVQ